MKRFWPRGRTERVAWAAVALVGVLSISARWIETLRPESPDRSASVEFRVTRGDDAGSGTLRDAILAADQAPTRARITIAVPRVTLQTQLPPLVNPMGVVVDASLPSTIDAKQVSGAVLDIAAPGTFVSGLLFDGGGAAIVVRADGVTIRGVTVRNADTGALIGEGAKTLRIVDSSFDANRIGIQVAGPSGETVVQNASFSGHRVAAVWAVIAKPDADAPRVQIADSHFNDDAIGLVAVNVNSRVERNGFDDQRTAAVHVNGGRAVITANRIRAGRGFGIFAQSLQSGYISRNEIARNCNGAMLLRDVSNTQVISNELYQNGYGVVLMEGPARSPNYIANNLIADHIGDGLFLIGASPIISRNQVLRNRQAGIRLSTYTESGSARTPTPLLTDNLVRDNGSDEKRDEFESPTKLVSSPPTDCSWRGGTPAVYAGGAIAAR